MPNIIINDFEVVPAPLPDEIKLPSGERGEKNAPHQPMTDHEAIKMLERCAERLERVSVR